MPAQRGTATITVTPKPVQANGEYRVEGTGADPSLPVHVVMSDPHCCAFFSVTPDDNGNWRFRRGANGPAVYEVETYQRPKRTLRPLASTTFDVVG